MTALNPQTAPPNTPPITPNHFYTPNTNFYLSSYIKNLKIPKCPIICHCEILYTNTNKKLIILDCSYLKILNPITQHEILINRMFKNHDEFKSLYFESLANLEVYNSRDLQADLDKSKNSLPLYAKIVSFEGNYIGKIDSNSINVEVEQLNLSKNMIEHIDPDTFRNLKELKFLDLSQNRVFELMSSWLPSGLLSLNLADNLIDILPIYNDKLDIGWGLMFPSLLLLKRFLKALGAVILLFLA